MFKKPTPPAGGEAFASRLRRVAEQKPAETYAAFPPQKPDSRAPRQTLFKNGVVTFGAGQKMNVAIKNISNTGAQIEFVERGFLPDEVTLHAPLMELKRRARVVWQREGSAGLHFI